jgi:predicted RNA-binding protein YlxR (DUF448 family)
MKKRRVPLRTCIGCREIKPKSDLVRIVRTPGGEVRLDNNGKLSGRGAYLCLRKECYKEAIKKRALQRALKIDLGHKGLELEKDFYMIVNSISKGEEIESSRAG